MITRSLRRGNRLKNEIKIEDRQWIKDQIFRLLICLLLDNLKIINKITSQLTDNQFSKE
jgi:hypothetical protein